ncbi:hypothetical protein SSE37_17418 [Sagittula stellata E-37]|uniref:Uncharacterized protein n=1 Tax=Sagittula stellata (strain ATCC 700073 / DSM 11524 / E-37) TaxID=388399 RepID=A3K355_SAGS3|nr:hypothetical protein SSE37_17418 [Sagittula stellata E-37]
MLNVRALSLSYGQRQILSGVDLDLAAGEMMGLGGDRVAARQC